MKSAEVFHWGPPQQQAFKELKDYLIKLTTLSAFITLCVSFVDKCKWCLGPRDGNQRCKKADACLLRFQSIEPIQNKLHRDGEGPLCGPDGFKKASAVFPVP
jgi:hypothetical protein